VYSNSPPTNARFVLLLLLQVFSPTLFCPMLTAHLRLRIGLPRAVMAEYRIGRDQSAARMGKGKAAGFTHGPTALLFVQSAETRGIAANIAKLPELVRKLWVKVKNPNAPAVKREAEEDWGK
jgi:hypothetical protein